MSAAFSLRLTTNSVAAIFAILNILHLAYGLPRLRARIAAGEVSAGLATPFTIAWLYVGLSGLALSILLFVAAPGIASGNDVARKIVVTIALTLVVLGMSAFAVARQHPGLLIISLFGIVLLIPVVAFRAHFG